MGCYARIGLGRRTKQSEGCVAPWGLSVVAAAPTDCLGGTAFYPTASPMAFFNAALSPGLSV
jgi:hypothetical protein